MKIAGVEISPAEIKLIEKFRECLQRSEYEKRHERDFNQVSRSFSVPSSVDSEEQINISVSTSISSVVSQMTDMQVISARASEGKPQK